MSFFAEMWRIIAVFTTATAGVALLQLFILLRMTSTVSRDKSAVLNRAILLSQDISIIDGCVLNNCSTIAELLIFLDCQGFVSGGVLESNLSRPTSIPSLKKNIFVGKMLTKKINANPKEIESLF